MAENGDSGDLCVCISMHTVFFENFGGYKKQLLLILPIFLGLLNVIINDIFNFK